MPDLTLDTLDDFLDTLVGLHAPQPAYVDLLMPRELEPDANRAAARLAEPVPLPDGKLLKPWSSCALLVRSVWRLLGCEHPILRAPYRNQHAVSDVIEIAQAAGAWHDADDGDRIEPGRFAAVLVGEVGHEHFYLVRTLDALHGDGMRVTSIDGGQGSNSCAIAARTRLWPSWSDRWRDVNDLNVNRPVRGWADTALAVGGRS